MSILRTTRTERRATAPPHTEPTPPTRSGPRGLGPLAASPPPPPPPAREPAPAPEPVEADPGRLAADAQAAGSWSFTARARTAMDDLRLSVADVIEVLDAPATVRPSRRAGGQVATRRGLMVVHDRAGRCVLSVVREHGGAA